MSSALTESGGAGGGTVKASSRAVSGGAPASWAWAGAPHSNRATTSPIPPQPTRSHILNSKACMPSVLVIQ